MSLVEIHGRLANTALFYVIIMAAWGLFRFFRKEGVDSSYWGALVIAEILLVAQTALGAFLYISGTGRLENAFIHILYGVVSILVIPGLFLYTRGDEQRRSVLLYGVGFLFMIGIVLRAMATAA